MTSIWKMIYDLEHWIEIGIGDDIIRARTSRPEYQVLVQNLLDQQVPPEKIPGKVLVSLKEEADLPFYKRPTFWLIVRLTIKRMFKR